MNIKEIERILQLMLGTDVEELEVTRGPASLRIRRRLAGEPVLAEPQDLQVERIIREKAPTTEESEPPPAEETKTVIITSPLVGTFYRAPTPEEKPFVEEGEIISKGQVLCIVEAMKLMNEIRAEESGKVTAVLVENGHPVEYGEPLFEIEPS